MCGSRLSSDRQAPLLTFATARPSHASTLLAIENATVGPSRQSKRPKMTPASSPSASSFVHRVLDDSSTTSMCAARNGTNE